MQIVITLCTRERPELLRACLNSILAQHVPQEVALSIVVVENHERPTCQSMVLEKASQSRWPVSYAYEPRLGIPIARNRALALALQQEPDWIGFIDDDEVAQPDWILGFLKAMNSVACDVFQGPVEYIYPERPSSWSRLPTRKHQPTGYILRNAATSNTFMRSKIAHKDGWGLRFNETMRFTGGSDNEYFFRASDLGARICWMNDAVVSEIVPRVRTTLKWQLSRTMRVSANAVSILRSRRGAVRTLIRCLPKYGVRLVRGAIAVSVGAALTGINSNSDKRLLVGGLHDIWSSLGALAAFLYVEPQPYKVVHVDWTCRSRPHSYGAKRKSRGLSCCTLT